MNEADLALHLRLLAGDKTAPDDCVVCWLPELVRGLSAHNPSIAWRDEQIIYEAALRALLDYTMEPHKYDPARSSLRYYLRNAAQQDLKNELAREKTQGREAMSIHPVEFSLYDGNSFEDEAIEKVDAEALMERVMEEISDPVDRLILSLVLQGERSTSAFAKVLGIEHLPEHEQRRIVKQNKDRISKRLERLGEAIRG